MRDGCAPQYPEPCVLCPEPCALAHQVKPLGVYAMIDDGELDWKIIAISTEDPLADKLNDVEDVERCVPLACGAPQLGLHMVQGGLDLAAQGL